MKEKKEQSKNVESVTVDIKQLLGDANTNIKVKGDKEAGASAVTIDVKQLLETSKASLDEEETNSITVDMKTLLTKMPPPLINEDEVKDIESKSNSLNKPSTISENKTIHMELEKKSDVNITVDVEDIGKNDATLEISNKKVYRSRLVSIISDSIFYSVIVLILVYAILYIGNTSSGLAYQLHSVVDNSMEPVYAQGSILIVNRIDIEDIDVGDRITFYRDESTILTREIVAINEEIGKVYFETSALGENLPDIETVYGQNVIGKVVTSIPLVGYLDIYITDRIELSLIMAIVLIIVSTLMRYFFGLDKQHS